jgi:hypothetical protein
VTSMTFLSLKWTVKLSKARRAEARRSPPDLRGRVRGGPDRLSRPGLWASAAGQWLKQGRGAHLLFSGGLWASADGSRLWLDLKSRTDQKWSKPNIRLINDTLSCTTVDFSNFSQVLVKISKFHNFANNGPIFIWFVLNDVFYRVLQLFFCVKVEFIKNKACLGGPPSDSPGWRQSARHTRHHSTRVRYHENFKVRMKT